MKKYKILGDKTTEVAGFIVGDVNAKKYEGLVGEIVKDYGHQILLKFSDGNQDVFRATSLTEVSDLTETDESPKNRYSKAQFIEIPCKICGNPIKLEKSTADYYTHHCQECSKDGKPWTRTQPISDEELIRLYFDELMTYNRIAEHLEKEFGKRPGASTVARWLRNAISGTDLKLRTLSESMSLAKQDYKARPTKAMEISSILNIKPKEK